MAGFFPTFGDRLALGRPFRPEENAPGRDDVVVVSHSFWQQKFGGAPDAIGRTLSLDGRDFTVVGVTDEDFFFPSRNTALWTPLVTEAGKTPRADRSYFVLVRLKADVSAAQATTEMATIARRLASEFPDSNHGWTARVETLRDNLASGASLALTVLYGSITFVFSSLAQTSPTFSSPVRRRGKKKSRSARRSVRDGSA